MIRASTSTLLGSVLRTSKGVVLNRALDTSVASVQLHAALLCKGGTGGLGLDWPRLSAVKFGRAILGPGEPAKRLQPLRGDPDNPPPEGTNKLAQARTPQAWPSGPVREKNFNCLLLYGQLVRCCSYCGDTPF